MADDSKKVKIRVLEIEGDPDSLREVLGVGVFAPPPLELEAGDLDQEKAGDPDQQEADVEPEQPQPVAQQAHAKRGWCSQCDAGLASHKHREHMRRTGQLCETCNRAKSSMEHQERCAAGPKGNGAAVPKENGPTPNPNE